MDQCGVRFPVGPPLGCSEGDVNKRCDAERSSAPPKNNMNKFIEICLIIAAGAVVAIADVFIKKMAFDTTDFKIALKNPLMLAVIGLYIAQIIIFIYLFTNKSDLSIVGIGQAVMYSIIVVGSGVLIFNETISLTQSLGLGFAVIGIVLMNL